jgi:hypothetical protein
MRISNWKMVFVCVRWCWFFDCWVWELESGQFYTVIDLFLGERVNCGLDDELVNDLVNLFGVVLEVKDRQIPLSLSKMI